MSIAKVSLLSELSYITLKRYIQSKPDNYQEAAQEYSAQLRKLYRASLNKQHQRLIALKLNIESESFRLEDAGIKLNGISIERGSLPCAKLNDRVVLIKQDEQQVAAPFVKGTIVGLTSQQIKIKFDAPIFEPPHVNDEDDEAKSSAVTEPNEPIEGNSVDGENKSDDQHAIPEKREERTAIEFKIKFDPELSHRSRPDSMDFFSKSVEKALSNFERLKCNQTLQRTLLGLYDERNDTISDRARVMTFSEIVPSLNSQQQKAIQQALMKRLTLIEGPAGTGKTVVAAHIAAIVSRQGRGRVLVCSLISSTVDKLTEMISSVDGCRIVKLPETQFPGDGNLEALRSNRMKGRKRDSYLKSETKQSNQCHLDKLVDDEIYLQTYARFKQSLGGNHDKIHAHAFRMVNNCSEMRRRELETKVISKADVVCCQLNELSNLLLKGIEFDMLIVDDVQVTSELDCLIAIMTKGIKQVVLLSDTRRNIRLARISMRYKSMSQTSNGLDTTKRGDGDSKRSNSLRKKRNDTIRRPRSGSSLSENINMQNRKPSRFNPTLEPGDLFERLVSLGLPTVDMRVQYRCHVTISNFFNHHFYASRLKDDANTNDKMSVEIVTSLRVQEDDNFTWLPNKNYLTAIFKTDPATISSKPNGQSGESIGKTHVENILEELVNRLSSEKNVRSGGYRVGIIHNSRDAAKQCNIKWGRAKIGTIDEFIGQQEDFIILVASESSRRHSSDRADIGISSVIPLDFTRVDTVLNWVLTRARLGLFIVCEESFGDPKNNDRGDCFSWRELINYYDANQLIVEAFANDAHPK